MLATLREHRRFFLWAALAGLALRLFFFAHFPSLTDDSRVYLDLATNLCTHGIYGQTELGQIVPTDSRLPGYPAFLAAIFWIVGIGKIRAVLITQLLVDLGTCLVIADLARRTISNRFASRIALALAATCPFLANYSAAVLTETLEVFFTAIALDCMVAGLDRIKNAASAKPATALPLCLATGAAIAASILLRPDGGILLASVFVVLALILWKARPKSPARIFSTVLSAVLIAAIALAPLVPWTIRNYRVLHHFQPLAPRYANSSSEAAPNGFNRWAKTWIAEYVSVEEIYWNVPGDKIDVEKLPARALDEPPPRNETLALLADYNQSQDLTPQLDARFADLAAQRIRAHPLRYYVELPLLRIADMWLRPRTELLPPDIRWWEFNDEPRESALAIAFGLINLLYVALALVAVATALIAPTTKSSRLRYLGLTLSFVLLRSLFLGTIGNPEPRYTLECYPVILLWASAFLASKLDQWLPKH